MKNSSIAWTHHTFNPWWGCTKVSPGCANCYAESWSTRFGKDIWGKGKERQRTSAANWKEPLASDREAAKAGERKRVFCASMADAFDSEVPRQWRNDLFDLIRKTQHLDWLLLTKRPEEAVENIAFCNLCCEWAITWQGGAPVWLGFSAEDQQRYDERIDTFQRNPAPIGFISAEPLLGPIDLHFDDQHIKKSVNWVIGGGESGPKCRPMKLEWAIDIVQQCKAAGVACFVKQLGGHPKKRENIESFPPELQLREFPQRKRCRKTGATSEAAV